MYIFIYIGLFIASSIICHFIAKSRYADKKLWALLGAIFGPLAIPFAFLSKKINR